MRVRAALPLVYAAVQSGSELLSSGDVEAGAAVLRAVSCRLLELGLEGPPGLLLREALRNASTASSEGQAQVLRSALDSLIAMDNEVEREMRRVPSDVPVKEVSMLQFPKDAQAWYGLHDGVMGGISEGRMTPHSPSEGEFSGQVRTEFNGGFASVRRKVNWDASSFRGVYIDVRSEDLSRGYVLNIKDALCMQMGGVNFKAKFKPTSSDRLTRIYLPFEDFVPEFRGRPITRAALQRGELCEVSIMAMKPAGEFRVYVGSIGLFT